MPEKIIRGASVVGTMALLGALLVFLYDSEVTGRVFALLALGLAGLSVWIIFAPEEVRALLSGRRITAGTTSLILLMLFTILVIVIYVQVDRQNITVDFTSGARFSLNEASLQAIERVQDSGLTVRLVAFYPREYLRERESADIILRQYDAEGDDSVELQYIDPAEDPIAARTYGYDGLENKVDAIFATFVTDEGMPDIVSVQYIGAADERAISTTLLKMLSAGTGKFYFTQGHNELSITSQADTGILRAARVLDSVLRIQLAEINLLTAESIPEDATALVIVGPSSMFDEKEVQLIESYVEGGGRLVILANPPYIDPVFGGANDTFLESDPLTEYLWDEFGVRLREDLVVDLGSSLDSEFNPIPSFYSSSNPMMQDFSDNLPIVMSLVRSIEVVEQPDERQSRYLREPLMLSSEQSYGESGLQAFQGGELTSYEEGEDAAGPLLMGVAVRIPTQLDAPDENTRLVLVGDVDWVTNQFVTNFQGNALFWSNIGEWMTSTEEIPIFDAQTDPGLLPIAATQQQRQRISLFTTIFMPLMVLAVGLLVWFTRRRQWV
ncbi:MAG: Gldg family protein [Anaerolineae bacterium]|nr:Gldg family protein [Anaerolineae bacterium]